MRNLLLAATIAVLAPAALAEAQSFDCKRAKAKSIAEAVCSSPMLLDLDREMDRLYRRATEPGGGPIATTIRKEQRAWAKRRNACAPRQTQETCARDLYLERIARIRSESAVARSADRKGISFGPAAFHCGHADVLIATFVNAVPGMAWITWQDRGHALEQARSGSGARYESDGRMYWEHQGEATWRDGTNAPEVKCRKAGTR